MNASSVTHLRRLPFDRFNCAGKNAGVRASHHAVTSNHLLLQIGCRLHPLGAVTVLSSVSVTPAVRRWSRVIKGAGVFPHQPRLSSVAPESRGVPGALAVTGAALPASAWESCGFNPGAMASAVAHKAAFVNRLASRMRPEMRPCFRSGSDDRAAGAIARLDALANRWGNYRPAIQASQQKNIGAVKILRALERVV